MRLNSKKKILLFYDYFSPAYKAGGPIQSCTNLVRLLHKDYQFYVITSNEDLGDHQPLQGIKSDCWTSFEEKAEIFYISRRFLNIHNLRLILKNVHPDIIYVNGIYSFFFSIFPVLYFKFQFSRPKIIVSPRGMLQPGSLSVKPLKKTLFLKGMKLIKLYNNIRWHATTEHEKADIIKLFNKADVKIAGNIPNIKSERITEKVKEKGKLSITTIALISPMKNILKVLEALNNIKENVTYHIYGPVKDPNYWNLCLKVIKQLPANIEVVHKGPIDPSLVSETLNMYQFMVLPSKSENFGHVIFESFVSGTPVIISEKTPWNYLEEKNAGWNIDSGNLKSLVKALESAIQLDQKDYNLLCVGSRSIAENFISDGNFEDRYQELFN